MAKKMGNYTLKEPISKPPTVLEALFRAQELAHLREAILLERQTHNKHALEEKLHKQSLNTPYGTEQHLNFTLKQMLGLNNINCVIKEENQFSAGSELQWIRALLSLDALDPDSNHDNRNDLILKSKTMKSDVTSATIIDVTKDQVPQAKRKVNDKFIEDVVKHFDATNNLPQSLMVQLTDDKNKMEALALTILNKKNGLWVYDPKIARTFIFDNKDTEGLAKFLKAHLQEYHQDCTTGSIIQVFNKEKFKVSKELHQESRADPMQQLRKTQHNVVKEKRAEQKADKEEALSNKNKDKPTTPKH